MKRILLAISIFLLVIPAQGASWELVLEDTYMDRLEHEFVIKSQEALPNQIEVNGQTAELKFNQDSYSFLYTIDGDKSIQIKLAEEEKSYPLSIIPLWMSIIPPLLAILLALLFREVLISLFIGIAFGTVCIGVYANGILGVFTGFARLIDTYIIKALLDSGHLSIIIFSMIIGALVALVSKNGGMKGVVNVLSKFANNAQSGQFATYLLGIAIFFDDYANTLVVGNTMRPVTDKLGISREKLSYIVDSTAAPVASIAFITTWIGAELSYLSSGINQIPEMQGKESAYGIFLGSLQYAFYPILTLIFIFFIIRLKRDFGPMWSAEMKSRAELASLKDNPVEELKKQDEFDNPKWYNAAIPIALLVLVAIVGLLVTGSQGLDLAAEQSSFKKLAMIIGNADSYKALLWASLTGLGAALILTLSQRLLDIENSIKAIVNGFESLLPAILILVLAWTLAIVTEELHTADFLSSLIRGTIGPFAFPLVTFILSALVSFATGSSWGTMAILYPLLLTTSWGLGQEFGYTYDANLAIFMNVSASVLAGSVLGDHCSPISDTTILSSLATRTNHIQHVRTQMPYALTVGSVAAFIGILPAAIGLPWWVLYPIAILCLYLIVRYLGKPISTAK